MLPELRDLLNRLDDADIDQLCLDHFPCVYDKFGRGMSKQEKITVLLDYCRRKPEEGKHLHAILQIMFSNRESPGSQSPIGGAQMDNMLALAASLQFAYWFWNATIQPAVTRFSETIGATLGEIGEARIKRWFGDRPPVNEEDQVDESLFAQQRLLSAAQTRVTADPEWQAARFMDTTKRVLVRLLRDPQKYSLGDLQIFWQDFGDPGIGFNLLLVRFSVGDTQASIADELVMETIRNGKLPQLIAKMRRAGV